MDHEEFRIIVKASVSKSEVCRRLGWPQNGSGLRRVSNLLDQLGIETNHFSHKAAMDKFQRRWPIIEKICPICSSTFETQKGHPREKTTCSHSCSNSLFRERRNKPEHYGYRKKGFRKWGKKCLICNYSRFVHVHHIDGNHDNNDENNLIPLCGNHHQEVHHRRYFKENADILLGKYGIIIQPLFDET